MKSNYVVLKINKKSKKIVDWVMRSTKEEGALESCPKDTSTFTFEVKEFKGKFYDNFPQFLERDSK